MEEGGQDDADGADIDVAEDMAADGLIDRADVGAGAATDTAQGVRQCGRFGQGAAAVVEQHDVQLLLFAGAGDRAANPGDVRGQRLAGGVLRQHADDLGRIFQGRHQFLDTDQGDMDLRQGRGEPGVAFVGDQARCRRFRRQRCWRR